MLTDRSSVSRKQTRATIITITTQFREQRRKKGEEEKGVQMLEV